MNANQLETFKVLETLKVFFALISQIFRVLKLPVVLKINKSRKALSVYFVYPLYSRAVQVVIMTFFWECAPKLVGFSLLELLDWGFIPIWIHHARFRTRFALYS
ncbi:MAG: hypothetical protein DRR19_15690 [Candidatus Parabeggiatoa sp. nov. 1]|nr:MAG: hypothetical protein DRR19_15690 [Gammaproteobacteria bacterium]